MSRPSASTSHTPTTSNISGARRTRRKNLRDGSREAAVSVSVTSSVRSKSSTPLDGHKDGGSSKEQSLVPINDKPWRHPDELEYICRQDWSKDLMITYLCQKSFSIPRRDPNTTNGTVHITQRDGSVVVLPRGYRVPLMFLAVFQWDSLRLVLLSTDPESEWEEYKFDIIHLCRLCQHLFRQAASAATTAGAKGIDKNWRSPMFDRVLTRFYHKWLVSREWSVRKFWEEFEEEEYRIDPLKYDWIRWSKTGHQGFSLTKEEIQQGISAETFMKGLSRSEDGIWSWDPSAPIRNRGPHAATPSTGPLVPSTAETEVITDIQSKPSVEIKRENIDSLESGDDTVSTQTAVPPSPSSHPASDLNSQSAPPRTLASSKRLREESESDTLHAEKRKRVVTPPPALDKDPIKSQLAVAGEVERALWQNVQDVHVSNVNTDDAPMALPSSPSLHPVQPVSEKTLSGAIPPPVVEGTPSGRSSPPTAPLSTIAQEAVSQPVEFLPLAGPPDSSSSLTCVTVSGQIDTRIHSEGLDGPASREDEFVKSPSTSSFSIASSAPSPSPQFAEDVEIRPPVDLSPKVVQRFKPLDESVLQRAAVAFRDNLLTPPPEASVEVIAEGLPTSWDHLDQEVSNADEPDKESSEDMELDSENEETSPTTAAKPIITSVLPTLSFGAPALQVAVAKVDALELSQSSVLRPSTGYQPSDPPPTLTNQSPVDRSNQEFCTDQEARPNGLVQSSSPAVAILRGQALEIYPHLPPLKATPNHSAAPRSSTTPSELQMSSPSSSSIPNQFRKKSVGRAVSTLMRNVADLLEVAGDSPINEEEGGIYDQGKGKAREAPRRLSSPSFLDDGSSPRTPTSLSHSPVISLLLEEVRAMRSQMQRLERNQAEGMETLRLLYRSDMASLREELKETKDSERAELGRVLEEHEQRFVARIAKQEEELLKKAVAPESQAVSLVRDDIHDLRRKVASLELRYPRDGIQSTATTTFSPPFREATPPTSAPLTGTTMIRQPIVHSLGIRSSVPPAVHDHASSQLAVERRSSNSTSHGDPTVVAPPLPIKSQRKHYSTSFSSSSLS